MLQGVERNNLSQTIRDVLSVADPAYIGDFPAVVGFARCADVYYQTT